MTDWELEFEVSWKLLTDGMDESAEGEKQMRICCHLVSGWQKDLARGLEVRSPWRQGARSGSEGWWV